jgi:hypothetical protein
MLESLDTVPWEDLERTYGIFTAYGSAKDIPILLRRMLSQDPKEFSEAFGRLYDNVLHQGTRFPVTSYIIPSLIEMCANAEVYNRVCLLSFWGSAIAGYFSIQERPHWGDGEKIYENGEISKWATDSSCYQVLHQIYCESLKGTELLGELVNNEDKNIRAGAIWVLACMPTIADYSVPKLKARLKQEVSGLVRAGIAFALGELGASEPLHHILAQEQFSAAKCIAACQLARIDPQDSLIEQLLEFIIQPINGYEDVFGTGGKSTDDAAFAVSYLPRHIQQQAIPAICQRLKQARSFDTMPLVRTLLSAAFEKRDKPLIELTDIQNLVLCQMLITDELWSIGNLIYDFPFYGLPDNKEQCAKLVGIKITTDKIKALEIDSTVFERVPTPAECWLLYAKAFAESNPKQAIGAFRRAILINPDIENRVSPTWHLADLLKEYDF